MKKKNIIVALTAIVLLFGCNNETTTRVNVNHTLTTTASGLTIDDVFISTEEVQPEGNTFIYGQTFYTNFKGISGFEIEEGDYFPEMEVFVISKAGDTVLQNTSLMGGLGQPEDVPVLHGSLILANPILSGTSYTAKYKLYDTKGTGAYFSEMDFEVIPDPAIIVKENGLQAAEVYLFDRVKGKVITDGKVTFGETVSMDFQLLEGYKSKNDKINLGMEVNVTDATGSVITKVEDALINSNYDALREDDVIQATLKLTKGTKTNPITWQVRLWDKNSDAEVFAKAIIEVVE
jgi:hypothetical protein